MRAIGLNAVLLFIAAVLVTACGIGTDDQRSVSDHELYQFGPHPPFRQASMTD